MGASVHCRGCGHRFAVDDVYAGKLIRCVNCKEPVRVPSADGSGRDSSRSGAQRRVSQSGAQRQARPTAPRRSPTARSNRYQSSGPSVATLLGIVGGIVAVGVVGFIAFRMGQNTAASDSDSTNVAATDSGAAAVAPVLDSNDVAATSTPDSAQDTTANSTSANGSVTLPSFFPEENSGAESSGTISEVSSFNRSDSTMNATEAAEPAMATKSGGDQPASSGTPLTAAASWADLNEQVEPSVVKVEVRSNDGEGIGSGFVADAAGFAVTNYHVVEGCSEASLVFANRDRIPVTGVVFLDPKRDIAILQFDPARASVPLRPLPLATSAPRKGEEVAAFGAPRGLDFSFSQSVVNAVRKTDELTDFLDPKDFGGTWIQHSTPISPGNSGGPLVNIYGQVVAINTFTLTTGQALNFAISAQDISDALSRRQATPKEISPINIPVVDKSSSGSGGDSVNPNDRPDVVDATDNERGRRLMAQAKQMSLMVLAFTYDPRHTVAGAVTSAARDGIERSGLRYRPGGNLPVLVIAMKLERQGVKNAVWVTATVLVEDRTQRRPELVRVWEQTGELGGVSEAMLFNGVVPPNLQSEIRKFFAKLRVDFVKARKEFPAEAESKSADSE